MLCNRPVQYRYLLIDADRAFFVLQKPYSGTEPSYISFVFVHNQHLTK